MKLFLMFTCLALLVEAQDSEDALINRCNGSFNYPVFSDHDKQDVATILGTFKNSLTYANVPREEKCEVRWVSGQQLINMSVQKLGVGKSQATECGLDILYPVMSTIPRGNGDKRLAELATTLLARSTAKEFHHLDVNQVTGSHSLRYLIDRFVEICEKKGYKNCCS